ncbi:MAG: carbohydrate-binding protein, partial [Elainellaceae cyanobacterium]
MLLTFDSNVSGGYNPGEIIQFGVDVDPNSILGLAKKPTDINGSTPTLNSWDMGGVSGAELINSKVHVLFTDGTEAVGELIGDGSQGGSATVASQASPEKQVTLTANGLAAGGAGSYTQANIQVLVSGTAGDTARIVLTQGFIQPFDYVDPQGNPVNISEEFIGSPFPANQAIKIQTVDVLLDGTAQDITALFDFGAPGGTLAFSGDDKLPIGFAASVIDADELPVGPVTEPIYLTHSDAGSNTAPNAAPTTNGIADVAVAEGAPNTLVSLFDAFDDVEDTDAALSFQVVGNSNPGLFEVAPAIDAATGQLTLDYLATGTGSSDLTIRATDSQGDFVEDTFTVTVNDPATNTAPTTNGIADVAVVEGAPNTLVSLFDAFDDIEDADTALSFQVVGNSNPGLFEVAPAIDAATGQLTLDYFATGTGSSELTIRATDTQGDFVENTFTVTVSEAAPPPPSGVIRIEAEDYKAGANGVEYFDTGDTNQGGEYRPTEAVDIQTTTDEGGGFNVGWINAGEWLTYDINVPAAGVYDITFRVATKKDGRNFALTAGGQSYDVAFNSTGGFQSWQDVVVSGIALGAGPQELRLDLGSNAFNFNYLELAPAGPMGNAVPTTSGIADIAVAEGSPNTLVSLFDAFDDIEDADTALSFQVVGNSNPGLFEVAPAIDATTGQLILDYLPTGTGSSELTIRATDTQGDFVEDTFTVTVNDPATNTAPTTSGIADVAVTEGSPNTLVSLFDAFDDIEDADTALSFQVVGNSNPGLFEVAPAIDAATGQLTLD